MVLVSFWVTPLSPSERCFVFVSQVFGFEVPKKLVGVASKVLIPRDAWSDKASYDATRSKLAGMFKENFVKFVTVRPQKYPAQPSIFDNFSFHTVIFFGAMTMIFLVYS